MTFSNWPILLLLFVPAAILCWNWIGHHRSVVLPLDHGRQGRGRVWQFFIDLVQSIPAVLLMIAIILWAGPRRLSVPKSKRALTNIEICLDLSGSMTAPFGEGTRYDAAMAASNEFVRFREGDAYGLTIFGTTANQWVPLTTDPSALECATPFLRPERLPPGYGGGTMIGLALRKCEEVLTQREEGDRMIILVSDGASADLSGGKDEIIGRELRDNNIVMYGIHIGEGEPPAEVAAIANITGGEMFRPGDERGLNAVFRQIDQMQVVRMEKTLAELLDFFWPFAVAGLGLLGVLLIASFQLRYTPW